VPRNIVARSIAIQTTVVAAFFASGFLNAWTPFEIASILLLVAIVGAVVLAQRERRL
jgi:NADH:ubiquinone oxidoreductase subunit 6 (subunit J)